MTENYVMNNLNFFVFFQGKRPLLEEFMFTDDINKERFETVKQLLEKCWDGDFNNRPTMKIIVSCFAVRSPEVYDLDISPLFENIQLSKYGITFDQYFYC